MPASQGNEEGQELILTRRSSQVDACLVPQLLVQLRLVHSQVLQEKHRRLELPRIVRGVQPKFQAVLQFQLLRELPHELEAGPEKQLVQRLQDADVLQMKSDHQASVVIFYLRHRSKLEAFHAFRLPELSDVHQSLPQRALVARVKHTDLVAVVVHDLELDLVVKVAWFAWCFR